MTTNDAVKIINEYCYADNNDWYLPFMSYDELMPAIENVFNDLRSLGTQESNKVMWNIKNYMWLFKIDNTVKCIAEAILFINQNK